MPNGRFWNPWFRHLNLGDAPPSTPPGDRQRHPVCAARRLHLASPTLGTAVLATDLPFLLGLAAGGDLAANTPCLPGTGVPVRQATGRQATPSGAVIDSQSVKTTGKRAKVRLRKVDWGFVKGV